MVEVEAELPENDHLTGDGGRASTRSASEERSEPGIDHRHQ